MSSSRINYPVAEILPALREQLKTHTCVILQAPPGAGKSTIVPLELREEPWLNGKKIIMLQPRRLAARAVASRMAELLNEKTGASVGYRVRFENVVGPQTQIEVVTEGILTRMLQTDNALEDVGLVIFDEFHERSLHADLALALCRQAQQLLRPDLRLLIMSATLDTEKISGLLGNAPVLTSLGRQFPVELVYEAWDKKEHITALVSRTIRRALREHTGDVLVFLPGAGEIRRTQELLEQNPVGAEIFPLYGDLPLARQREAILPHPAGARKVVLATTIAETSLTIEGITVVIDAGLARVPRFDPRSGLTTLETAPVTQDAADQRAGRAGRLGPGICYRLWAKATHAFLRLTRQPEILEADLAPLLLELYQWGTRVNDITWITPPPTGAVAQADDLLTQLGAIHEGKITERGKAMLRLPTHPRIAHVLTGINAQATSLKSLATDVAALLEERDPLPRDAGADLSLRIDVLRRWRSGERVNAEIPVLDRIERLASQWRRLLCTDQDNSIVADTLVGKLLAEVYPERVAKQTEKFSPRYKLFNGRVARLPEHDGLLQRSWLAVGAVDFGSQEGKIFSAAPLDETDLQDRVREVDVVRWDTERGAIVAVRERQVGALVLSSQPLRTIDESLRIATLCEAVREEGLKLLRWDEPQQHWQARVLSLRRWRSTEPWPDVSDQQLIDTAQEWLAPFLTNVMNRADFGRLDLSSILPTLLSWELQQAIARLAPDRFQVPSGSWIRVEYSPKGDAPVLRVRLQEVFGWAETPTVNDGKTKIVLHLLSPGYKPVQVTQDLHSFWNTTYHEVRKELRMRYPKHHWPDDPWTAEAVRGAKRRT